MSYPRSDPHRDQPILHQGEDLSRAKGVVILLHGRGASAEDILGLAHEMPHPGLAFLAPQAAGHVWYPTSFLAPIAQNDPDLTSALAVIARLVEAAVATGVPATKIALCGFSQGACLSTEFVARHPRRYGGLIAFTGGLIGTDEEVASPARAAGSLAGTPAFLGSGDPDPHVPWARVLQSASILAGMGAEVVTEGYPGRPHTIIRPEIDHANRILAAMLAAEGELRG